MTVAEALRAATERLADTSDTARLDAELLMAHALGVPRSDMLLRHMTQREPVMFEPYVIRRAAHEPVAYIVGEQEFYGRSFAIAKGVLIPRPDSETTLEAALELATPDVRVLDCGTGSGALLLSFLAERPEAAGIGIDNSATAGTIAALNTQRLGLTGRAQFLRRDWTQPGWADDLGTFDLILANPPYVEDTAELEPDVRDFEPAEALFAGVEGLDDYRILIPQLPRLLRTGGVAVIEIGASQACQVTAIAESSGFTAQLRCDLAKRPRTLILHLTLGK